MKGEGWKTRKMVLLFGLAVILMPVLSHTQEYPRKPITLFSPTIPGNSMDVVTRALLEDAKKFLGQPFIVVTKSGGGGTIAMTALAKEKPDGYTLGMCTPLPVVVTPLLRKMSYALEDFTPVLIFADSVAGLVVRADAPWKTLKDLVEYGRANPRKIKCAIASGTGNFKEIAVRVIAQKEQIDLIFVPYSGDDSPGFTDLLGGHIEVLSAGPIWVPHARAGKVRPLVTYMSKRLKSFPDVPTLEELGYGLSLEVPLAIVSPKGTPPSVVKKLDGALHKAMDEPGFKETISSLNYQFAYYNSDDAKKWLKKTKELWTNLIKEFNIPKE